MRKLTLEYVTKQFEKKGYKLFSKEYKGTDQKLDYECSKHKGQLNTIRYSDLRRGSGCRYCGTEKRDATRRTSFSVVKQAFIDRDYILVSETYKNSHTPLLYICKVHPLKDMKITYSSLKSGSGCSYCAKVGKPVLDDIRDEFKERGYTLLSKEYENSSVPLEYACEKHPDKISKVRYGNFKSLGHGCTHCSGNIRYDIKTAKELFEDAGYELLEENYINNVTPMRYRCSNHLEEETYISLKSINNGARCSLCYVDSIQGSGHPRYNPEITDEQRHLKRDYPEYARWRAAVFERDNYTCKACGDSTGGNLIAHHKDGYGWNEERRVDVTNGATLCESCHADFHTNYGYGDNTEAEYGEWMTKRWRR